MKPKISFPTFDEYVKNPSLLNENNNQYKTELELLLTPNSTIMTYLKSTKIEPIVWKNVNGDGTLYMSTENDSTSIIKMQIPIYTISKIETDNDNEFNYRYEFVSGGDRVEDILPSLESCVIECEKHRIEYIKELINILSEIIYKTPPSSEYTNSLALVDNQSMPITESLDISSFTQMISQFGEWLQQSRNLETGEMMTNWQMIMSYLTAISVISVPTIIGYLRFNKEKKDKANQIILDTIEANKGKETNVVAKEIVSKLKDIENISSNVNENIDFNNINLRKEFYKDLHKEKVKKSNELIRIYKNLKDTNANSKSIIIINKMLDMIDKSLKGIPSSLQTCIDLGVESHTYYLKLRKSEEIYPPYNDLSIQYRKELDLLRQDIRTLSMLGVEYDFYELLNLDLFDELEDQRDEYLEAVQKETDKILFSNNKSVINKPFYNESKEDSDDETSLEDEFELDLYNTLLKAEGVANESKSLIDYKEIVDGLKDFKSAEDKVDYITKKIKGVSSLVSRYVKKGLTMAIIAGILTPALQSCATSGGCKQRGSFSNFQKSKPGKKMSGKKHFTPASNPRR